MTKHCHEHPIGVVRIDNDGPNLLSIAQAEMLPAPASISRFVNSISNREIRAPQAFAAARVDHIGI